VSIASWYDPQWAGGWAGARIAFAVAALLTWVPRGQGIGDVYGVADMVFSQGPLYLSDVLVLTEPTAWAAWAVTVVGLLLVGFGGRGTKPGLVLWLLASTLLLGNEALNIKAYDRLLFWIAMGLMLGPVSERGLTGAMRSPLPRWFLMIVFCALYGSTGWLKIIEAGADWAGGAVLANHLVHQHFGQLPAGVFVSGKAWLVVPMSWVVVLFEAGFPLLIWWRRSNPWVLVVGLCMHAGIFLLMRVGPFSFVALAAYPILLHPEVARSGWARITRR
jgi:hypothetical protein